MAGFERGTLRMLGRAQIWFNTGRTPKPDLLQRLENRLLVIQHYEVILREFLCLKFERQWIEERREGLLVETVVERLKYPVENPEDPEFIVEVYPGWKELSELNLGEDWKEEIELPKLGRIRKVRIGSRIQLCSKWIPSLFRPYLKWLAGEGLEVPEPIIFLAPVRSSGITGASAYCPSFCKCPYSDCSFPPCPPGYYPYDYAYCSCCRYTDTWYECECSYCYDPSGVGGCTAWTTCTMDNGKKRYCKRCCTCCQSGTGDDW